jgi:peptide deformylase
MFEICTYGCAVLRKKAVAVERFDEELRLFVEELTETMYERDGVGLAAPQVGRSIRVAVVDAGSEVPELVILVNPVIVWKSDELGPYEEGCLSVPDLRLNVDRPVSVSVEAQDINGKPFTIEKAVGLKARALQHEIDHLDGIMFVDRVSPLQRQLIATKLKKMAKTAREPCNA